MSCFHQEPQCWKVALLESCRRRCRLGFNGCEVLGMRSSLEMSDGVRSVDGSVEGCFDEEIDSSLDRGAMVAVVVDELSGLITVDGRADGPLGWA